MRERGVNVVTISGSSAGGLGSQEAIREVERIRSREGNVTILAVIDSFMHLFVNKMVTLYIERKWLTRIFEDEVQDNPCEVGRGGGGGFVPKVWRVVQDPWDESREVFVLWKPDPGHRKLLSRLVGDREGGGYSC